ncbi:hypothetical protein SAMN04489761_3070 [Tenacibaculum sp. MAR_2009_124]|uniref:hypothetical protein n=1 Tax=Tenacibaculum sp. MAR_2009_124 TaxID=1250059 RepID=UPI000898C7EE|nr:hypothetical protein [Tenacibaculum sp. MAR_2009_124]SEC46579.1 hypothetical protein SAMN04489761_3070 [Tenacibaculum sp. MAR_2009_124]
MDSISLKEVLQEMKKTDKEGYAIPFSLSAFTFNSNTKKGGNLRHYENARFVMSNKKQKQSLEALTRSASLLPKPKKNPSHFENGTINIEYMENDKRELRKIKIRFIKSFNEKLVVY